MIGGKNVFARVKVEFVPRKAEQPVTVANKLKPNDLPAPFPDVIVRGLRSALQSGGLGFPVLNVHATVLDVEFDPERSTEPAFEAAADDAVRKAFSRENMQLLEPMMKLTVTVPSESSGNVFGYLMARRGAVDRQDSDGPAGRDRGPGPAGQHVRLRRRAAEPDPGAGQLDPGAALVRPGPGRGAPVVP